MADLEVIKEITLTPFEKYEDENKSLDVEQLKDKYKDAKSVRSVNFLRTLVNKRMDVAYEDKRRAVITALTNASIPFKSVEYDRHGDKITITYG